MPTLALQIGLAATLDGELPFADGRDGRKVQLSTLACADPGGVWVGIARVLSRSGDSPIGALNLTAHLRADLQNDLDRVVRCVRIGGFVNSVPEFLGQSQVIYAASDLFVDVFGDASGHARIAVGISTLPYNVAVEVEAIFEVR